MPIEKGVKRSRDEACHDQRFSFLATYSELLNRKEKDGDDGAEENALRVNELIYKAISFVRILFFKHKF